MFDLNFYAVEILTDITIRLQRLFWLQVRWPKFFFSNFKLDISVLQKNVFNSIAYWIKVINCFQIWLIKWYTYSHYYSDVASGLAWSQSIFDPFTNINVRHHNAISRLWSNVNNALNFLDNDHKTSKCRIYDNEISVLFYP